ncbi:MAG: putative pyridoxal-dependent aspartate 1-decarboxylase [Polyangiaceae bacterium]|nr:putative pyridoxal-dependent aspartate 1-decarboxylase [Polyangiaceae bacterium]
MRKVFTLPESDDSTLAKLDREISENLVGFLRDRIVAGDIAPANLEQDFLDTRIPDDPTFVAEQTEFLLTKVVSQSVHTWSPYFVGHMTSAIPYFMVPLAKIMVVLNQNLVKIETSKAFTPLERQVIGMLHRLVYGDTAPCDDAFYERWTQDFHQSLGNLCSGGTIANVTALWVARNRLLPPRGEFTSVSEDGLPAALRAHGYDDLVVLVSKRGHYSLRKAADLLGLGRKQLIAVPVDENHKVNVDEMRRLALEQRARRRGVVAVVGIAGTTETGSVDDLPRLADLAAELGCSFHVDAAWGGPTLFSSTSRHLLRGVERADSVTLDAHKQLYVPMGAGACLFRDPAALNTIETNANYIIRRGSRDIGKHTLEGSRPGMAMLLHSGLRILGRRGYELLIDLGIGRAAHFAEVIRESDDFELISEPELNILTYRFLPPAAARVLARGDVAARAAANAVLDELTESIQKRERARGKTFVSRTRFEVARYDGRVLTVLRVVLANPLTSPQILADILDEQRGYAAELLESEGYGRELAALAAPLA